MDTEHGTRGTALRAVGVSAGYGIGREDNVIHDVSLSLTSGGSFGVVGESGSGKSTLARVLVGQLRPAEGKVFLGETDIWSQRRGKLRNIRRRIQLIPQDPYGSLDPRMTIGRALQEAISPAGLLVGHWDHVRVDDLLRAVSLDPDAASRYPQEFSGGERQRIAIARALAVDPEVLIADEITSSLDASVQAEILNLLRSIQRSMGLSLILITHDLAVANYMCGQMAVLYLGRVVETGTRTMLLSPEHPYTKLLVDSVPQPEGMRAPQTGAALLDEPGDPLHPPSGCAFHPRCPIGPMTDATRRICIETLPELVSRHESRITIEHRTACHFPLGGHSNIRTLTTTV